MKIFQLLVLSLVALALGYELQEKNKEWELFKITHSKVYDTKSEEIQRMKIFLTNQQFVKEHNEKYNKGEVSFTTDLNEFSDWSNEEINLHHKGYLPSSGDDRNMTTIFAPQTGINLPASIDWRTKGAVTAVKNQGHCGSCWAFSAVGSLESQHFIKSNKLISLSAQNLVDCAPSYGCHGGYVKTALLYVKNNKGINTEKSYPYKAADNYCYFNSRSIGATVKDVVQIPYGNEIALQVAVATIGPVSVAIDATDKALQYYRGGVYYNSSCSSTYLNHCVVVVGYGTTNDGQDYWLIKNSWGTGWGMEGYGMIARNQNMCGIAMAAVYPVV